MDVGQFDLLAFDPAEGLNCPLCGAWYDSESLSALGSPLSAECEHTHWRVEQPFWSDRWTDDDPKDSGHNDTRALRALALEYANDAESDTVADHLDGIGDAVAERLLDSYYEEFHVKTWWWVNQESGEMRRCLYAFAEEPHLALQAAWSSVRRMIHELRNPFRRGTEGWSVFEERRREYAENIEDYGPTATP